MRIIQASYIIPLNAAPIEKGYLFIEDDGTIIHLTDIAPISNDFEVEVYEGILCPGFVNTDISKNALTGNGSPQGKLDKATGNGMSPKRFAILMIKAIENRKEEVYISGVKEKLGVYVKRFFPRLFSKLVRKIPVT